MNDDLDPFREALFARAARAGLLEETEKLVRVLGRFINVPAAAKLVPKVIAPPAVLALARPVIAGCDADDMNDALILVFAFVGLLAKEGSKPSLDAIERFTRRAARKDDFALQGTILMLEKAGKGPAAAALAARLGGKEKKRRAGTPAQALAEQLDLPMRDKQDWRVTIWIGVGEPNTWFGMLQKSAQVHLRIEPRRTPDWEVELQDKDAERSFDCRGGEILSNDFRLPALKELRDFPRWLAIAGKKVGARFSAAKAKVDCGRYRAAKAPLRAWLAGGG